jgi:hypothetical protein
MFCSLDKSTQSTFYVHARSIIRFVCLLPELLFFVCLIVLNRARGLAARTLELAGVPTGPRQLTGCQPAGWLIYGAPVAMELGRQLWPGVCAPSLILSGDQQI